MSYLLIGCFLINVSIEPPDWVVLVDSTNQETRLTWGAGEVTMHVCMCVYVRVRMCVCVYVRVCVCVCMCVCV